MDSWSTQQKKKKVAAQTVLKSYNYKNMSQPKDSKKDNKISTSDIDDALKNKKVYFSWKSEYYWSFNVYKRNNYYHVRADKNGKIQTCGTHTWERVVRDVKSQTTTPHRSQLETPKGDFKEEIASKIGLTKKQYLKLYQAGKITIGGGATTEMSFTVKASGDDKEDMDYIERVLRPTSFGYFRFNF